MIPVTGSKTGIFGFPLIGSAESKIVVVIWLLFIATTFAFLASIEESLKESLSKTFNAFGFPI
ncbi:hypothetical protein D3C86_1140080 [compost metagenome]